MRPARRGTRSTITNFVEVIAALPRTICRLRILGEILGKRAQTAGHIENHPMNPCPDRGVRVVSDERKALRTRWRSFPLQRRRHVAAFASERLGDGTA